MDGHNHPFPAFAECLATSDERERWLELRRTGLGASDVPSILGIGFQDPGDVWAEKRGLVEGDDLSEIERIQWGLRLEEPIIRAYAEPRYAGRASERCGHLLRSLEHPWALATLDAMTTHPTFGPIPLEVKTSSPFAAEDWADGAPDTYYMQVHAQMLVTGAPAASIACLIGGQRLVWCDVERDEATIARIVIEGRRFWSLVESGELPPVDGSDGFRAALEALYPVPKPETCALLPDDARFWQRELEECSAQSKLLEAREKRAKNEIRALIADCEEGRFSDGSGWTYRTVQRRGYTVDDTSFRQLRVSAAPKREQRKRVA